MEIAQKTAEEEERYRKEMEKYAADFVCFFFFKYLASAE